MEQHFQKFPKKAQPRKVYPNFQNFSPRQGAKKVIFTACHLGKLKLTFSIPNIISTSPKNVLMSRLISQFFCNLNSSNNFTCPLGKLITQFTSPITKSRSPGPSDTTFFACYWKFWLKGLHFGNSAVSGITGKFSRNFLYHLLLFPNFRKFWLNGKHCHNVH